MRTMKLSSRLTVIAIVTVGLWGCDPSGGGGGSGGTTGSGGDGSGGTAATGGSGSGGTTGSGGDGSGGTAATGGAGSGGAVTEPDSGSPGEACTAGPWPEADPAAPGPFATVTENEVGPTAGVGPDGGAPPRFTLFRPSDLAESGRCHPVITWGNGTGSTPSLYKVFLNHLATHGFVVIASDSTNVAKGSPPPMVAGVTWVLEQHADPSSPMYQRIDTAHVGATGHSQGGFATTQAGSDSHITTIAPLCGASAQRNLHGPAWLFCGGGDTTVPCSSIQSAYDGINNQPVMLANYLSADHANWVTFSFGTRPATSVSAVEAATVAWMRVHLMDDTSLRSWFYGADCKLCQDPAWEISRKLMDE